MNELDPQEPFDPLDLSVITAPEELFLWRLRRRATNGRLLGRTGPAQSQAEAAAAIGLSLRAYSRLETGEAVVMDADQVRELIDYLGANGRLRPTRGELCMLARRRSGFQLSEIEVVLEVSRPIFHRRERAGDETVVAFWRSRGFRFPASDEPEDGDDEPAARSGDPVGEHYEMAAMPA